MINKLARLIIKLLFAFASDPLYLTSYCCNFNDNVKIHCINTVDELCTLALEALNVSDMNCKTNICRQHCLIKTSIGGDVQVSLFNSS